MLDNIKANRKDLAIIICLALILRFALAVFLILAYPKDKFDDYIDTQGYMLLAENLLEKGVFSGSENAPYAPDTKRTPGFPLYLGIIYSIFGFQSNMFFFVNSLISALTCGFAFLLCKPLLGIKTARLAAILLAVDIDSILTANYIITETLFTFLLICAIYVLFQYLQSKNIWHLLFSVLLFALVTYVRPNGIVVTILLLCGLGIYKKFRKVFNPLRFILSLAMFFLLLLPWYVRNYTQVGRFEFSSAGKSRMIRYWTRSVIAPDARSRGNSNLRDKYYRILNDEAKRWLEENPDFKLSADGLPISDAREYQLLEIIEPQLLRLLKQNYIKVGKEHIFNSLGSVFSTIIFFYNQNILNNSLDMGRSARGAIFRLVTGNGFALRELVSYKHAYLELTSLFWTLLNFTFAIGGFILLIKNKQYLPALVFAYLVLIHIFISGVDALPRFRVPALPYLFAMSAVFLKSLWEKFPRKQRY